MEVLSWKPAGGQVWERVPTEEVMVKVRILDPFQKVLAKQEKEDEMIAREICMQARVLITSHQPTNKRFSQFSLN